MSTGGYSINLNYSSRDMNILRLVFTVKGLGIQTHFDGKRLRSALGPALRGLTCERPGIECRACDLRSRCLYALLYEPGTVATDKGPKTPPVPYVLRRLVWQENTARVEYLLFGPAMRYATFFGMAVVRAIHSIGDFQVSPGLNDWISSDLAQPITLSKYLAKRGKELVGGPVRADFLTPLRIKSNGKLITRVTTDLIATSIGRRGRLLLGFYGYDAQEEVMGDVLTLPDSFSAAETRLFMAFNDDHRYSARQRRIVPAGGITGYLKVQDPGTRGLGLLVLGELLNIGSATSMGFGAVELTKEA